MMVSAEELPPTPLRDLTAAEIASYWADGAAVIRGILPQPWIDYMRQAI
jgi:hypothetical protein